MRVVLAFFMVAVASFSQSLFSEVYHHDVATNQTVVEWTVDEIGPFDELLVSWNAVRPKGGQYEVYVGVKCDEWTEDLLYAIWGADEALTFTTQAHDVRIRANEDTVELLGGAKATGFRVKVAAKNGATLDSLWALHASTCDVVLFKQRIVKNVAWKGAESIQLPVKGRSQVALDHPRHMDLCSPTSTSAVVSYLSKRNFTAVDYAKKVRDASSDIYGNWIFNVAEGASFLGKPWNAFVARYESFEQIYANLKRGIPSVVTIRGPLPGTIFPYSKGHLVAVIGYDSENDRILCMDPAYNQNNETLVEYDKNDFLQACVRRGCIGYFFEK